MLWNLGVRLYPKSPWYEAPSCLVLSLQIYAIRVPGYLIAMGSPRSGTPAMAQAAGGAF